MARKALEEVPDTAYAAEVEGIGKLLSVMKLATAGIKIDG
jgi:hypothetical protein